MAEVNDLDSVHYRNFYRNFYDIYIVYDLGNACDVHEAPCLFTSQKIFPIPSMHASFINLHEWLILMVNVGKYTIHGCHGYVESDSVEIGFWLYHHDVYLVGSGWNLEAVSDSDTYFRNRSELKKQNKKSNCICNTQKNGGKPLKTRRFNKQTASNNNSFFVYTYRYKTGLNFGVTSSNHTFKLSQIPDEILLAPLLVFWANKFMKPLHCLAPDFRIYCQYPVDAPHEWYIYLYIYPLNYPNVGI